MSSFKYQIDGYRGEDAPMNLAIENIVHGEPMMRILRRQAQAAKALFAIRARKGRTKRLSSDVSVDYNPDGIPRDDEPNYGVVDGYPTYTVEANAPYSAAVEFGRVNKHGETPQRKRRTTPGDFPAAREGAGTFGGDNRRIESIVAWIERDNA